MNEIRGKDHWNQRYHDGDLPWDTGIPEERLMEVVRGLELPGRTALDIGCGAGTNAIELARMGLEVTGLDISEEAVEMARQRAADAGVDGVRFEVASIVEGLPIAPGSIAVATDRGCFHGIAPAERPLYVTHLAEALSEGGWWVVLAACCEEVRRTRPVRPAPAPGRRTNRRGRAPLRSLARRTRHHHRRRQRKRPNRLARRLPQAVKEKTAKLSIRREVKNVTV